MQTIQSIQTNFQTNSTYEKITKKYNPESLSRKEREKQKDKRKGYSDKRKNWE